MASQHKVQNTIESVKAVDIGNEVHIERSVWLDKDGRHIIQTIVLDREQAAEVVEILTRWLADQSNDPARHALDDMRIG